MLVVLSGLLAGALHVVSGPDHLAAIGPLAAAEPGRGARLGATWGVGHGGGVLILTTVMLLVGGAGADLSTVSARFEALVGLTLVALGIWSLQRVRQPIGPAPGGHHAAFGVGLLHGTAGAGHLVAALPALGLNAPQAFVYLGAYLAAATLTMSGAAWLLAASALHVGPKRLHRLRVCCSLAAILVGAGWTADALR